MKWHRNPFFHTAVMPPSVAPSALASTRPSADLDGATAAAARAAAARGNASASARPSTDLLQPPAGATPGAVSGSGPSGRPSMTLGRPSITIAEPERQHQHDPSQHLAPHGILAEAANRVAQGKSRRRKKTPKLTICEPSDHLTPYQTFYIFGLDGLGAFLLSGGINFAIAYAMYKTIDTEKSPIRVFQFPNTLAGDATVTIFIQCVITWFIELVLVNRDLRSGHIQPIGFIREPQNALLRWFLLLDRRPSAAATDSPVEGATSDDDLRRPLSAPHDPENCHCEQHREQYEIGSWKHWAVFLVSQLIRALMVGVLMWFLMWGPSIGILIAVGDHRGNDWWFDGTSWAPPIFKLVFGGVLALLTTPPFAAFWLVRCGWAVQANQRHLDASAAIAAGEPAESATV
ncbi:hypothetical protein SCUCBS95973_001044 [Sporothrix curviconia]|uniref:Uncharacterized protein n=1 Tax=Sporothrix curviconia TaxID=1260050 RepID=A0ABP0AVL4_9PEZI